MALTPDNSADNGKDVASVGEGFLRLLASRGVDFLFANAGTDFPPLVEGLARARRDGFAVPKTLLVPHENVAVGMAYGATMVSGRAQALMVHVNVGTANALCGLINAARENVPMLLAAGRTPLFESGQPGSRSLNIHWAQEMFDQAGMVREHVKWDYELRGSAQLESVLDRALAIAASEPQGPVYLSLPREVLAAPGTAFSTTTTQQPAAAPAPDPDAIAQAAAILARARHPLIITARAGRERGAVPLLAQLAERFALPVVDYRPRYMSMPNNHPMHGGYESAPWLDEADAILVLDCDVPWMPAGKAPRAGMPVIQAGSDPLFARYPTRGFHADVCITGTSQRVLAALGLALERAGVDATLIADRRERIAAAGRAWRAAVDSQVVAGASALNMASVSRALSEALARAGGESIVINEYSLVPAAMDFTRPGSYFGSSPVGGLGWGLPAALGAKLASPGSLVVAAVGDGSYTFANPLACHHAAAMYGIATLTLVMNNGAYGAVDRATRAMYPQGIAVTDGMHLVSLAPVPRYDALMAACGGHGERVEQADAMAGALDRAIRAVRDGRQALVDVMCA